MNFLLFFEIKHLFKKMFYHRASNGQATAHNATAARISRPSQQSQRFDNTREFYPIGVWLTRIN